MELKPEHLDKMVETLSKQKSDETWILEVPEEDIEDYYPNVINSSQH